MGLEGEEVCDGDKGEGGDEDGGEGLDEAEAAAHEQEGSEAGQQGRPELVVGRAAGEVVTAERAPLGFHLARKRRTLRCTRCRDLLLQNLSTCTGFSSVVVGAAVLGEGHGDGHGLANTANDATQLTQPGEHRENPEDHDPVGGDLAAVPAKAQRGSGGLVERCQ